MLPVLITAPFLQKWSDETLFGKTVMVACGLWMIGVLAVGGITLLRATIRASGRRTK
jgi:hypothetical protein